MSSSRGTYEMNETWHLYVERHLGGFVRLKSACACLNGLHDKSMWRDIETPEEAIAAHNAARALEVAKGILEPVAKAGGWASPKRVREAFSALTPSNPDETQGAHWAEPTGHVDENGVITTSRPTETPKEEAY